MSETWRDLDVPGGTSGLNPKIVELAQEIGTAGWVAIRRYRREMKEIATRGDDELLHVMEDRLYAATLFAMIQAPPSGPGVAERLAEEALQTQFMEFDRPCS